MLCRSTTQSAAWRIGHNTSLTERLTRKDARRGTTLGSTQVHFALRMWRRTQPAAASKVARRTYPSNLQRKINSPSRKNRTKLPPGSARVPAFAAQ
ncbi:hypothetical protein PhaeoP97_02484 [Phaeobacter porticola]|uniref:Uncharacterized protein n=1 Tax=Phaeobacter porticola TaxID=1844006 RepID=A0A1L3I6U0_9RHOB|nr:hypothetical protein PhaeoP97_02484 [Phaeobacter porticola]